MHSLQSLGWNTFFKNEFEQYEQQGLLPARISAEFKERYRVMTAQGEMKAEASGRLLFSANDPSLLPKTGDWCAVSIPEGSDFAIIHERLPRHSKLSRKEAGKKTREQVLAANVDVAFLVMGLDGNYNLSRLQRFLAAVSQKHVQPVVVLNKADLHTNPEAFKERAATVVNGVPVELISAHQQGEPERLLSYLAGGSTGVLLGSSGAGKSTITNALLGRSEMAVKEVREDDSRGRHTTVHRQLFLLPEGGVIIDTPGMRELQLWDTGGAVEAAYPEIAELSAACHFSDCSHTHEAGCAVTGAMEAGTLDPQRYKAYLKLMREARYHELKVDETAARIERHKWKKIHKMAREISAEREKRRGR